MGLLLVDWVLPVRRPTTEPCEREECLGHSAGKCHASGMLLTGFEDLFVDSVAAMSFIRGFSSLQEMEKARPAAMTVGGSSEDRWVLLLRTSM